MAFLKGNWLLTLEAGKDFPITGVNNNVKLLFGPLCMWKSLFWMPEQPVSGQIGYLISKSAILHSQIFLLPKWGGCHLAPL
jgi:hypothetical protein